MKKIEEKEPSESLFTQKINWDSKENFIEIKDIVKQYNDGNTAVNKINLNIKRGEFVTILGPSGCGKTTLLKMLGGFELPTSGKILVKKIDIKDLPIQRRPTATVFQDYALFPNMNVEKNISYGLKEIRKPIENIENNYIKDCEKYFNDCLKKSEAKIKDINKERNNYLKEISKLEERINSNDLLKEVNSWTEDEYDEKIEKIKEEYQKRFNKDLLRSIPFKVKWMELANNILSFFKIDRNFKSKNNNESDGLIQEYLRYERYYRRNLIIKNEIEYLSYKSNDLDYWISYWQNYPHIEKEWFEKKKLTRKLTNEEIATEVNKIISIVGLEGKNKKMPIDLSGGMQQRVALARALVIRPDILLLDEPLSALDAKVRVQMQHELKNLHKEIGITFILVTHDQEEALTLSDKVVVMSHGKIQQIGTPSEIYDYPSNNWVANFIGKANIFQGKFLEKNFIEIFGKKFEVEKRYESKFEPEEEINVMIRPEDFDVTTKDKGNIKVTVLETIYKGLMWELICDYQGMQINIESVNRVKEDQEIYLTWDDEDMHIMKKVDNDEEDNSFKILTKQEFKKRIRKTKVKAKEGAKKNDKVN